MFVYSLIVIIIKTFDFFVAGNFSEKVQIKIIKIIIEIIMKIIIILLELTKLLISLKRIWKKKRELFFKFLSVLVH